MFARSFPALSGLVARYRPTAEPPHLILITHLLPTAQRYLECLARVFDVEVIGIPYSSPAASTSRLRDAGFMVTVPATVDDIPAVVLEAIRKAIARGKRVVVQEVGGYLADCAGLLSEYAGFLGVIEDTNNGHWRYQAQDALRFPVVSIAQSPIKAIEDNQIGEAVAFSVERILREEFFTILKGVNVLVLGFGSIGRACANALNRRGASIAVFDVDPLRLMHASIEGYRTGPLESSLAQVDLVIGATGRLSIDRAVVELLKDGAIVASASSRQVECDVVGLRQEYTVTSVADSVSRYTRGRHHFYLVSNAYPVNFRDYSVIGEILDAIYSELFVCIREVAEGRVDPGLCHSAPALHKEVAEAWCQVRLHSPMVTGLTLLPLAPASLVGNGFDATGPATRDAAPVAYGNGDRVAERTASGRRQSFPLQGEDERPAHG